MKYIATKQVVYLKDKTEKTSETAAPTAMQYNTTMDAGHLTETKREPHHKYVEREL